MGLLLRIVLVAVGGLAALFVARDAPNFEVVQGSSASRSSPRLSTFLP